MTPLKKKQPWNKRLTGFILAGFMLLSSCIPAEAANVTTPISGLPSSSYDAFVTATVNSRFGKRSFHIFNPFLHHFPDLYDPQAEHAPPGSYIASLQAPS